MPSSGADAPSTVRNGSAMVIGVSSVTRPPTRNTTVRGPAAVTAARKLPGPASASVVTGISLPPRPAAVPVPKPSRPASGPAGWGSVETAPAINSQVVRPHAPQNPCLIRADYATDTISLTENGHVDIPVVLGSQKWTVHFRREGE